VEDICVSLSFKLKQALLNDYLKEVYNLNIFQS